jgi:hypothetical protein
MDLKRVALGFYQGSTKTAKRFFKEALDRSKEIDKSSVKPYLLIHLENLSKITNQSDERRIAEDALTYSTIFQNYVLHKIISSRSV